MIANRMGTVFEDTDNPFVTNQLIELVQNAYTVRSDLIQGLTDPRRDYNKECGYPDTENITIRDYQRMYDRNPIAARVVGVIPCESWQSPPEIYEDEDVKKTTEFEKDWKEVADTLNGGEESWFESEEATHPVWEYLRRLDIQSGVGHYGCLLYGFDDGKPLSEPVDGFTDLAPDAVSGPIYVRNQRKRRKLLYLSVFSESYIQSIEIETNKRSPRYNRPKYYTININDAPAGSSYVIKGAETGTGERIHWSRILHAADNIECSEMMATPRLRHSYNRCLDCEKLYGGSAEGYWRCAFPGLALETHPQLGGDVAVDYNDLRSQVWNYFNGLQKALALTGMSAKTLSGQAADPASQLNAQLEAICIELGIPVRIFKGSERGELASGQDDGAWNDRMRSRKSLYITPRIIVPFINRLILAGVLSEPKSFKVDWKDPEELKPQEKADVAVKQMDVLSKWVAGGLDVVLSPMDLYTRFLDKTKEEAMEILEGAAEMQELKAEKEDELQDKQIQETQKLQQQPPGLPAPAGQAAAQQQAPAVASLAVANQLIEVVTNAGVVMSDQQRKAIFAKLGGGLARSKVGGPKSKSAGMAGQQPRGPGGRFGETPDKAKDIKNRPTVVKDPDGHVTGAERKFKKLNAANAEKELSKSAGQWSEPDKYGENNMAVKAYAGTSDSFRINDCLRKGGCKDKRLKAQADKLSSVLEKASFPQDTQSYRAIKAKSSAEQQAILKKFQANIGKEFTDNAFVSTTANKSYADEWGSGSDAVNVTMLVPKGSKAIYVPKGVAGKQEWEVLIQRGSKFKVHAVEGSNVTLELL